MESRQAATRAGFVAPDFTSPLDVEAHIALAPKDLKIRGMLIDGMQRRLAKKGLLEEPKRYIAFKSYPIEEQLRTLVEVASKLDPDSLRNGMRQVGRMAFPSALETMAGRVVLGVLGRQPHAIFKAAGKALELVGARAQADVVESSSTHTWLHYFDLYAFAECYQVGVVEGVCLACGCEPDVMIKKHSPTEVELLVRWSDLMRPEDPS